MVLTAHDIHVIIELTISLSAMSCSIFVVYLALFRTKNQAAKCYAHMLIMNACVDFSYSIANFICIPTYFIKDGYFFISVGNSLLPQTKLVGYLTVAAQGFLDYVSVVMLAIQFIYRYSVLANKPLTSWQLLQVFIIGALWPFGHGLLCFYTFQPPQPKYDAVLRTNPVLVANETLPIYTCGDAEYTLMFVHFLNCAFITVTSYVVITIVYRMTSAKFAEFEANLTESTKRVQRQMEKVIIIQAIFPVFVLFLPGTILPIAVLVKSTNPYVGEFIGVLMHSTPVFNSFSVVFCVPSYRRIVLRWLCRSNQDVNPSSTGNKGSHDHSHSKDGEPSTDMFIM